MDNTENSREGDQSQIEVQDTSKDDVKRTSGGEQWQNSEAQSGASVGQDLEPPGRSPTEEGHTSQKGSHEEVNHDEVKTFDQKAAQKTGLYSKSYYSDYSDY